VQRDSADLGEHRPDLDISDRVERGVLRLRRLRTKGAACHDHGKAREREQTKHEISPGMFRIERS
jgi:hypothetical protein